jgi:GT2 family glycosyltransferase
MIDIFMTSFFRFDFTAEAIRLIHERTEPGSFQIHVYDNGSDQNTQDRLYDLLKAKKIVSLQLDSRNTGCLYNKSVFHAMTESSSKYLVVTDNDIYPPALTPDWLTQMVSIMDRHPELAFLTPQFPPQELSGPYQTLKDVVYCQAVGNAFKMVRRAYFPILEQKLNTFGDDGQVCLLAEKAGWKSAFCRNIFCFHAGQTTNWGYRPEEIALDPRKAGYGAPYSYELANNLTYEPKYGGL